MAIAYFIGGPYDLTKMAIQHPMKDWYCYAPERLETFNIGPESINPTAVVAKKHHYFNLGPVFPPVDMVNEQPHVYVYQGIVK